MHVDETKTQIALTLDALIVAVTNGAPRVLTVDGDRLPSGPLDVDRHATLERGIRQFVAEQAGLALGYVEQLYTFGDRARIAAGPRALSIAYLALMREGAATLPGAAWRDVYAFLPWEDWREGPPEIIAADIVPTLDRWADGQASRSERLAQCFGLAGRPWDRERVLERYELMWEGGLLAENGSAPGIGMPMAADHRRMLATALGRLRGKLKYRPVVFELLPAQFTLTELQTCVEALAGRALHTQNFRRLMADTQLVTPVGAFVRGHRGRPASLYAFRREVLHERPAPGVAMPRKLS